MKKLTVLMVAVGFILTASFSAQADSILFPWIVKSNSISTIVSVVNTDEKAEYLHYIYVYKPNKSNSRMDICSEYNFWAPTSPNDIVTFDATGNFGKSSLFETEVGVPLSRKYGNMFLNVEPDRRAYLIVSNNSRDYAPSDGTLYGEAMVVDTSIGAAWGYVAYNARGDKYYKFTDNGADRSGNLPSDQFGEVISGYEFDKDNKQKDKEVEFSKVVLMPPEVFKTKFFITPVGDNETMGDQWYPGWVTSVFLSLDNDPREIWPGIYDHDENPISINKAVNVVCTDAVELEDFLTEGAKNEFISTKAQGWAYVAVKDYSAPPSQPTGTLKTPQAIVGKLEYSEQRTTVGSKNITGAINNFIWLRAHYSTSTD